MHQKLEEKLKLFLIPSVQQKLTVFNNQPEVLVWSWWWRVAQTTLVPSFIRLGQLWDAHIERKNISSGFFNIFSSVSSSLVGGLSCFNQDVSSFTVFLAENLPVFKQRNTTVNSDLFSSCSIYIIRCISRTADSVLQSCREEQQVAVSSSCEKLHWSQFCS